MSETPQEILLWWMAKQPSSFNVEPPKIREAIRAVLAEGKRRCHNVRGEDGPCDCAGCRDVGALLAERDALRSKLFEEE